MKTLDRTRPFGTVSPPHNGIHYTQDNTDFDAHGNDLNGNKVKAAPVVSEKAAEPTATSTTPTDTGADEFPGMDAPFLKLRAWAKRHGFEGSKKDEMVVWLTLNGHA